MLRVRNNRPEFYTDYSLEQLLKLMRFYAHTADGCIAEISNMAHSQLLTILIDPEYRFTDRLLNWECPEWTERSGSHQVILLKDLTETLVQVFCMFSKKKNGTQGGKYHRLFPLTLQRLRSVKIGINLSKITKPEVDTLENSWAETVLPLIARTMVNGKLWDEIVEYNVFGAMPFLEALDPDITVIESKIATIETLEAQIEIVMQPPTPGIHQADYHLILNSPMDVWKTLWREKHPT